jgi:hypothetical protein
MAIFKKKEVGVGQFAKKGIDYKDRDIVIVANEGKQIEGTFGTQDVFLVKLPSGEEKNMTFNQTSINNMIDAYGDDSKKWIGKEAKAWLILQSVSGKMLKVLYLTHPSAEIVEDGAGFRWEIPGRQEAPKVATPLGSPSVRPVDYPAEEINPDDIPF